MAREAKLQREVSTYLREMGAFVMVIQPQSGIPTGTPDIIALFTNCWVALELKASAKSPFQPLQKETIAKLSGMGFARAVYPENWEQIKRELCLWLCYSIDT